MKSKEQLINNIIGQLNGIIKMMAEKKDCFQVLTQIKAVKSAFNGVMMKYIEDEVGGCMEGGVDKKSKEKIKILIQELIKK